MKRELDSGLIIFGVLLGLVIGGLAVLFYSPLDGRTLRQIALHRVSEVRVPPDRISASLEEGRAAVRSRQQLPSGG